MAVPYLRHDELEKLYAHIDNQRDRLLAQFLYESGCSVKDVTHLRTASIKPDGVVTLEGRTSRISPSLAAALRRDAGEYAFGTRQGATITAKRVQQILKPHLALITKEKPTPHLLRYTHIIHAYQNGVGLHAIGAQTGITLVRLSQIINDIDRNDIGYSAFFKTGKRGGAT